jgi:putative ABC transport system permease protein
MRHILADFRYAIRTLKGAPLFTALAAVSIALGIGANTTIFTLLDQIVLRPLPVERPDELVQLEIDGTFNGNSWGDGSELSYPMYRDIQTHNTVFAGMFARFNWAMHLSAGNTTERVNGELVSGTYFPVLGVKAFEGRVIGPSDDRVQGGHPVAVLGFDYWKTRFAGNRGIVGQKITLNGHPFTVIGVAQEGFSGIDVGIATQVFVPMMMKPQMTPGWNSLDERRSRFARVFARLRPGVTAAQAEASLQPFFKAMRLDEMKDASFGNQSKYIKQEFRRASLKVIPTPAGHSTTAQDMSAPLWTLMAIVAGVLLITCANVAGLLVARGIARQREIAIRLAVGGSRARVVQQLVIESVLLGIVGAIGGLLVAAWGTSLLMGFFVDPDVAVAVSPSPDARIVIFTFVVAMLAAAAFGLVPAFQATRPALASTLKEQAGSVVSGGPIRLRKALVVGQVALSLLLLAGAGLFVRSLQNLLKQNPGYDTSNLFTFTVDPSLNAYDAARARQLATTLVDRITGLPGVTSVSAASHAVLRGGSWNSSMTVEGYAAKEGEDVVAYNNTVMPGYFATMRIPLLLGRDFTRQDVRPPSDTEFGFRVAIANQKFVEKYLRGVNPLGRHVGFGAGVNTPTRTEIVGVVGTSKYVSIREEAEPQLFFPLLANLDQRSLVIYVRTTQVPAAVAGALRQLVREIDPNLPIVRMRTMESQVNQSLTNERLVAGLSATLGGLATLLAVIGLYGVMAYTVTRRTREVGIRMALGARARLVAWLFLREAMILVAVGCAVGISSVWAFGRYVESQLYGVAPLDPGTIAAAVAGLGIVAAAGALAPAFRATRINPLRALREE